MLWCYGAGLGMLRIHLHVTGLTLDFLFQSRSVIHVRLFLIFQVQCNKFFWGQYFLVIIYVSLHEERDDPSGT